MAVLTDGLERISEEKPLAGVTDFRSFANCHRRGGDHSENGGLVEGT